jgi:predicted nucleic acid-binding protein
MAAPRDDASLILLDACCVLNLYGGRCIHQLLRTSALRFAVAERAAGEALYVRNVTADGTEELESVDLHPLIAEGLLRVLTIDSEVKAAAYVRFATQLDDGEAMTCALAAERGAAVATDDRKAQRLLQSLVPPVPTYSTAWLIRQWALEQGLDASALKVVLNDVRVRARFAPSKHDPLQIWWEQARQ